MQILNNNNNNSPIDMGERVFNNPLVIFLHIPKCAGTTINGVINWQYGKQYTYRFDGINNVSLLSNLDFNVRKKLKLIRGHFAFGLHEYLSCPSIYFTFLRDPIERTVSKYYYIQNNQKNLHYETVKTMSLKDYICSNICNHNLQGRMLFGLDK